MIRVPHKINVLTRELCLRLLVRRIPVEPPEVFSIFAEPRGGSTWLEEIIRCIPNTATLWEPLDIDNVSQFRDLGLWRRQPVPEHADWPELEWAFNELFHGRTLSFFLMQSNSCQEILRAEHLLVKFCRGMLMLPWLIQRFNLRPPVYLVRHPCAIVSSSLRYGSWDKVKQQVSIPEMRYPEIFMEHEDVLRSIQSLEERIAFFWAINQKYLLQHPLNDIAWITVTYEELLTNGEAVLHKIFNRWGIPVPESAVLKLRTPSKTSKSGSPTSDPESQLSLWQNRLDSTQMDNIFKITEAVGVDIYDSGTMPRRAFIT